METVWFLETLPHSFAAVRVPLAAVEPQVQAVAQKTRDLMGNVTLHVLGYEHKCALGPCYSVKGDALYAHLQSILRMGLVLDKLRTALVSVESDGRALYREAYIEITGASEGRIAFCLHFTGRQKTGFFDVEKKRFAAKPA